MTYLACQWLVTVLVVRLSAGYDDAGLLSLAMSVVGIFGTFANYKMGTYQISDIRRENDLAEYLGFRCLTLGLAFVACMLSLIHILPGLPRYHSPRYGNDDRRGSGEDQRGVSCRRYRYGDRSG